MGKLDKSMLLSVLLASLPWRFEVPEQDLDITGITADSRKVQPGTVFVAVPGVAVDGHQFIRQALASGAVAVVGEQPASLLEMPSAVPYIRVADAREAFGWLHATWQGFPSRNMTLLGITGTDGKTTTTNLLYAILKAADLDAGMISTVNARIGSRHYDTGLHTTTPPADEVQHYLAEMSAAGTTHAVLEVTSHGLAQQRLAGCDFDVAVVTNITHEHLDYHGTWEAYRDAKAMLFRGLMHAYRKPDQAKIAVLNADDAPSYHYLRDVPADWQVVYGLDGVEADVTAEDVQFSPAGLQFTLKSPWGTSKIFSSLVGAYNVSNSLAAAATALSLGVSPDLVAEGLSTFAGVPGRMERIDEGQAFTAVVDFAHTPNALRQTLKTARDMVAADEGRVIVAFGCAGLRDREKRHLMGTVAAELADLIVITAEDPRTEPLSAIMDETAQALEASGRSEGVDFWRVPDRGEALLRAVSMARSGDIVLACGKGHEQSMCFGTDEYPWDDRAAMRQALHGTALHMLPTAKGDNG